MTAARDMWPGVRPQQARPGLGLEYTTRAAQLHLGVERGRGVHGNKVVTRGRGLQP